MELSPPAKGLEHHHQQQQVADPLNCPEVDTDTPPAPPPELELETKVKLRFVIMEKAAGPYQQLRPSPG